MTIFATAAEAALDPPKKGDTLYAVTSPDGTVAYVCRGSSCSAPLSTLEALLAELSATRS